MQIGPRPTRALAIKLVLSAIALAASAALIFGTYATWTSVASQADTITSGTVTIALGATGASTNRLNIAAGPIAPGDTMHRSFDLTNTGTLALSTITMTTTASPSSLLDTDATNGLQVQIDSCATAWTETGTSPAFSYTCSGGATAVVAARAVIGSNISLGSLHSLAAAGLDHLQATLTFPTAADNSFQGKTSTITFAFTGTQQAGSVK